MTILEKKVDAIARSLLARNKEQRNKALEDLRALMSGVVPCGTVREEIDSILTEIGIPARLSGFKYLSECIYLCLEKGLETKNGFWAVIYPAAAKTFNTTPSRVERGMRHALDVCFARCDPDVVLAYFGNTIDQDRGAPTLGEFIIRICYAVRNRIGGE